MRWIDALRARVRDLLDRSGAEERMREEIRFHIEMETEANVRRGMSPREARRRARVAFGGLEGHKERMRDARRLGWLEDLWLDLRAAARSLRRTPGFTVAAALVLALGVGTNAATFGLVSATLLRPPPFPEPDRLVTVYQTRSAAGEPSRSVRWSRPEFEALRAATGSFDALAAYVGTAVNVAADELPVRVEAEIVSPGYFRALGVESELGGVLRPGAEQEAAAVVGHDLWQRLLGEDAGVVGRQLRLNGVSHTVVGVMPEGFHGLAGQAEVWIPESMAPRVYYDDYFTSGQHFLSVIGRLAAGITIPEARAEVASVGAAAVGAAREVTDGGEDLEGEWTAGLMSLDEARRDPGTVRARLALGAIVFLVLLIAAINVSGLLLARSVGRGRERAIRSALGAARARLIRHALLESGLVGLLGGGLGLMLATWTTGVLATFAPERLGGTAPAAGTGGWELTAFATPGVDWRVVLFASTLAVAAGVAAGLVPALRTTRGDPARALEAGGRTSSAVVGSVHRPTVLSGVAVAQVACAVVLLVGGAVLLQGFLRLASAEPGFEVEGLITARVAAPSTRYEGVGAARLLEAILERVEAVPGVVSATVGRCLPGTGDRCSSTFLHFPEKPSAADPPLVRRDYVAPDHFRTLGIPLRRGRALTSRDRAGNPEVTVINETAARRFWPGEDPIGARVSFSSGGVFASPEPATEVVGIVADVRYGEPAEEVRPRFYTSYLQFTWPATMLMARTVGDPREVVPGLRRAVAAVDPSLPLHDVQTATERHADVLDAERFATVTVGVFAVLGLLLAMAGIYGVMSYSTAQRRREIGVRMAMGATSGQIVRVVLGRGGALAVAGLVLGSLVSLASWRGFGALVREASAVEPWILLGVAPVLLGVALLTCLLPARRAARVDPVESLAAD